MKPIIKLALLTALMPACMMLATTHAYAATKTNTNTTAASAPASTSISPEERAKVETIVHEYLVAKPEVLVEAMQVLQNRQVEQAKESIAQTQKDATKFAKPLFQQPNDPISGNKNGKITVVEFFDYQCPHCVEMVPVIDAVIKANPNIRVIYKDWPIRGPMSEFAARAALAANMQGKYDVMHTALLQANQPLTQDLVLDIAKKSGLDVEKLKKDMTDSRIDNDLKNTMKLAQDLKLFGTPAFFVGPTSGVTITYVPGQMNQSQMQDVINKADKK